MLLASRVALLIGGLFRLFGAVVNQTAGQSLAGAGEGANSCVAADRFQDRRAIF
jgi:hypothetical protein